MNNACPAYTGGQAGYQAKYEAQGHNRGKKSRPGEEGFSQMHVECGEKAALEHYPECNTEVGNCQGLDDTTIAYLLCDSCEECLQKTNNDEARERA